MQFFQQLFKKTKPKQQQSPYSKKSFWITALCSSKPNDIDQKVYSTQNKIQMKNSMSKNQKLLTSSTETSNSKQYYKVSFNFEQQEFMQLESSIVEIIEKKVSNFDFILKKNQLYGVVSQQKDPLSTQVQYLWLKIGKTQQINSLRHIQPYRFQKIFMIPNQFGFQYQVQQIAACSQRIYIRLKNFKQAQSYIELWQKQLIKSFAFRPIQSCYNKLIITTYKIGRYVWVSFNEPVDSFKVVSQLLQKVGFHKEDTEYETLFQQIPKGLTLQQYIQILKKKQKLQTQYEGYNVKEYLRHKFLQKMGKSRQIYFQSQNQGDQFGKINRSNTGGQYADYFNAINNSKPKKQVRQFQDQIKQTYQGAQQQQDQIFNFNVYKDQSEQQVKGVVLIKQRKNRSKSEQITNLQKAVKSDYSQDLDPIFYQNQ